jgi:IclR family transcriptional regulator, pca regulon regulatory protein
MPDRDYVQSLERGLSVISSFDAEHSAQTLSEVARRTGLTRATARRLLLTLSQLGYVRLNGKDFELTPRVLDIGYAFLSSLNIQQIAQPFLETLSETVKESVSVSVLDGTDIVYVARVPTTRIMTISLGLGTRLPAHCTSMGRVLLASLDDEARRNFLARVDLSPLTPNTLRSPTALARELKKVRLQHWALVDQELEMGLRSIAAPLVDAAGNTVAAMNISTHAGRTSLDEIHHTFLPRLLETAKRINDALAKRGGG